MKINNKDTKKEKIHSLLRCKNVNCNKLWNRDINGSLNILKVGKEILYNNTRPIKYRRSNTGTSQNEVETSSTTSCKTSYEEENTQ